MNTTSSTNSVKQAVIISQYDYDHPFTDMNCCWSTVYTVFDITNRCVRSAEWNHASGKSELDTDFAGYQFVDITDEIKQMYYDVLEENRRIAAKVQYEKFCEELDEYNSKLLPQSIGQIVEIQDGRNKGLVGRITWFGKNKFNNTWHHRYGSIKAAALMECVNYRPWSIPNADKDLILIRPLEGETWKNGKDKLYIDPARCKVIEGFNPITITEEDAYNYGRTFDDFHRKWNMGYNCRSVA